MARTLARADHLLARTGVADVHVGTRIFLTDGGWRWRILSLTSSGAFALTRPLSDVLSDAVMVNRSDVKNDRVVNGLAMGGVRHLSSVIAHERTHILVRNLFGPFAAIDFPNWKREGYADYIAGESSLTEAEVRYLRRRKLAHPALPYYDGRQRVEAIAKKRGGTIADVFSEPDGN